MGNAGRVLMIPKGDYNAATTYEMLDCVYYNGRSYVCKQASTGHAPTDTTYWQPMTPDASAEIQALTNYVGDNGVKNIWNIKAIANATNTGVTYTVNDDGTVNAVGTLTATESVFPTSAVNAMTSYDLKPNTKYKISLGITLSDTRRIEIFVKETSESSWSQVVNQNTGTEAEYTTPASWYLIWIRFNATGNGTAVNEKLYPMIRESVITDPTYAPYTKTNAELTADVTYKRGDTIAISSNPLYLSALFQDSKHLRLTIPINKPISASGATVTINSAQVFNNGNYEEISSGLTVTAYKVDGIGLYVIIENAVDFTTFTAFANATIRFSDASIAFT